MEMNEVSSTLIARYGYDRASKEMRVQFHSGGTWSYAAVPMMEFEAFLRAPSKGKHFRSAIKGRFREERLRG